MSQSSSDAEEITQDVFIKLYTKAHSFQNKSSVSTWIYRISVNTSLNLIDRRKRHKSVGLDKISDQRPDFNHPGVLLENKEDAKYLFDAIDTLKDSQKTAFILSFIELLPRQKVAEVMEISLKAVESLLQRAKQNLRKDLENKFPNRRKR